jgi:hypothetical protein
MEFVNVKVAIPIPDGTDPERFIEAINAAVVRRGGGVPIVGGMYDPEEARRMGFQAMPEDVRNEVESIVDWVFDVARDQQNAQKPVPWYVRVGRRLLGDRGIWKP